MHALRAMFTLGGLPIMMGQQVRSESLFYYFKLDDYLPANHLLRLIDQHISFAFVRERLNSYSEIGRPSIDREVLLRILLIGYLYSITSERKLVDEPRMHLAWRWITGLGFAQEIPHHSTFSKNRHGRFRSRSYLSSCLKRSCGSVWRWGWCRGSICRWTAASWRRMRPKRAGFHPDSLAEAGDPLPGISERAIFVIDKNGKLAFARIYPIGQVPSNDEVFEVLRKL